MRTNAFLPTVTLMAAVTLVAGLACPGTAWADDFEDAFNEGKAALGKAQYDRACEHFSKAEAIEGRATIKTRYQLGRCNEERKNFVDAHGYFLDAARLAERQGETKRAEVAYQRVKELERELSIVVLVVADENRIEGMTIELGDHSIPIQRWGQPVAVEPGEYEVTISAPNMKTTTLDFSTPAAGERSELVVPALAPAGPPAAAAGPPPAATDGTPASAPTEPDEPATERKSPGLFWTGMGLLIGGGVAGLAGLGAYATNRAADPFTASDDGVPPASIGLWIAGGVMIGVGIPFMAVFGQKVPVEEQDEERDGASAEEALQIEPLLGPTSAGLRVRF